MEKFKQAEEDFKRRQDEIAEKAIEEMKAKGITLDDDIIKDVTTIKTDTITLSSLVSKIPGILINESINLSEIYTRIWASYRTYEEIITLNSTLDALKALILEAFVENEKKHRACFGPDP